MIASISVASTPRCASAHLAANVTNLFILESVRRHYLDEYVGVITPSLPAVHGTIPLPPGPGLGVELDPSQGDRDVYGRSLAYV